MSIIHYNGAYNTGDKLPKIRGRPKPLALKGQSMRHEETRDNTTNVEAVIIEADAYEDTREADVTDPEHDPIGDAETDYDVEYDDEPEDDGQPSEYEEWQDFMGGDEYYDHSENGEW